MADNQNTCPIEFAPLKKNIFITLLNATLDKVTKLLLNLTFVIESINPIDASTFMIASEKKKVFWILNFVSK